MENTQTVETSRIICYTGDKVVLRPIHPEEDFPFLWKWVNDASINRFIKAIAPVSHYAEKEFINSIGKSDKNLIFAIETKADSTFIGIMGVHNIDWTSGLGTTGALIGNKEYWGKGFGTDAKMLVLHHVFHRLNLRRINSSVIQYNKRSAGSLLKCGYKKEGVRKQMYYRDGKYWDQILFRIFRNEFDPLWEDYQKRNQLIF
jgi:RimJ/RimL family protein N-acetyltransferase